MADPLEIAWTCLALAGLWLSGTGLHHAVTDLRFLHTHRYNGLRVLLAKMSRRREVIRTWVHLIFLFIGVVALQQPLVPSPTRILFTSLLMSVNAAMGYGSWADLRDRKRAHEFD